MAFENMVPVLEDFSKRSSINKMGKFHCLGFKEESSLVCWENISLDWLGGLEKAMNAKLWVLVGSVEQRMA